DSVTPEEHARFAGVSNDLPAEAPVRELGPLPALRETMEPERLTIEGATPGQPVLIRISYHPRWKATTGERVWLAGPRFMLFFPKGAGVELVYDGGPPVTLGLLLSLAGWVIFALSVLPFGRGLAARASAAGARLGESGPLRPVVAWARHAGTWSPRVRYGLLACAIGLVIAGYAAAAVSVSGTDADTLYRRGQELYGASKLDAALPYFLEAKRLAPLSATAIHSSYFSAIIFFRKDDWKNCEQGFEQLLERFPEAPSAAESTYHLGLCRARLGKQDAAVAA